MLLVGMLFDKVKPTMTSFLKPLVQEVNQLYQHGRLYMLNYIN